MDITILLDGKTGVSSKQLAMNMIKAAFIALEGDGNIELELNASSKNKPGQVRHGETRLQVDHNPRHRSSRLSERFCQRLCFR